MFHQPCLDANVLLCLKLALVFLGQQRHKRDIMTGLSTACGKANQFWEGSQVEPTGNHHSGTSPELGLTTANNATLQMSKSKMLCSIVIGRESKRLMGSVVDIMETRTNCCGLAVTAE